MWAHEQTITDCIEMLKSADVRTAAAREKRRGRAITVPMFNHGVSDAYHAFGTRSESVDAVAHEHGMRIIRVKQVHGTDILVINRLKDAASFETGYDAMVTDQPGALITVKTADCVPILFLDPVRRVVAAAHAGWRGSLGGIAIKTVEVMRQRFRCDLRSIRVAIGPSIGRCCYEVDEPVLNPLKGVFPYWQDMVHKARGGRGQLDLRGLNRRQLEDAGIAPQQIEIVNLCTACHDDLFFSYRRDGIGTKHMISGIGFTTTS